jgi:hypothetical protein
VVRKPTVPMERPITYVDPSLTSDVTRTTPHRSVDVPLIHVVGEPEGPPRET